MGWIADLLAEIPSAARYKSQLEEMQAENVSLKERIDALQGDLARARAELQKHTERAAQLGDDSERILRLVASRQEITAAQAAQALSVSLAKAEMLLHDLEESGHLHASYSTIDDTEYSLQQKGRKYLAAKGLL